MASIRDVAKIAGVSVGSVSRVYNGNPKVSEDVARRVKAAASEVGYTHPRQSRRGGVRPQTRVRRIGLITLGMDRSLVGLPVIAELLQGVQRRAEDYGQSVVVCDAPDPREVPDALEDGDVDAVVVKSALEGSAAQWRTDAVRAIERIPHVWLTGRPNGCIGDVCRSDDFEVGRLASEHLVGRGHKKLAYLNPKPGHGVFRERQASFVWHAEQSGSSVISYLGRRIPSEFPVNPASDLGEVSALVDELVNGDEIPTAIFVPADSIAVPLYRVLASRGIRVGEDISVISCNNESLLCSVLYPAITTVDIRAEEIGECAVDHLVWRADNPMACTDMSISLAPRLVEGDSVREITG